MRHHAPRLAVELSGCIGMDFAATMPNKIKTAHDARAAGWRLDLFCALEACSDAQAAAADGLLAEFTASLPATVANCTWWPQARGILGTNNTLRQPWRSFHHFYPYDVGNLKHTHMASSGLKKHRGSEATLSMMHKFSVLKQMRVQRPRYDAVWRTRPDTVVKGISWSLARSVIGTSYYMVGPDGWVFGSHTDLDVVLSSAAADRWGDIFFISEMLVACGVRFHPEILVHLSMISGGFECVLGSNITIQHCPPGVCARNTSLTARDFDDNPNLGRRETWKMVSAYSSLRSKTAKPSACNKQMASAQVTPACLTHAKMMQCIDPTVEDVASRESPYANETAFDLVREPTRERLVKAFQHSGCVKPRGLNGWLIIAERTAAMLKQGLGHF